MARRVLVPAIALILAICAGAALALTFPTLSGRVVDEAGLLSANDRAALTETLAALEAKTTAQLVVVTLKSLQGTTIEDYGYQLGRHWQIGQKDDVKNQNKNNGVLLIVAPNDRVVRIEVGYGLEGTLTDALTKTIIETAILPRFRSGDFAGGIGNGVAAIVQTLTGDAGGWQPRAGRGAAPGVERPADEIPGGWIFVVVLLGVGLLIFCAVRGGALCQFLLLMMISGGGGSSRGRSGGGGGGFSGGGGSFGGGGSSGRW